MTKILGGIVHLSNTLGVLLIWVCMVVMCSDVFSRNVLNKPLPGISDLVAAAIVVITFLQLPGAIRGDRLTRADFMLELIEHRWPFAVRMLHALFHLIGAAICFAIAYWTFPRLADAWTHSEFVGVIGILTFPKWPIPAVVFFGTALGALQYAVKCVLTLAGKAEQAESAVR